MHLEIFRMNLGKAAATLAFALALSACGGGNESRVDDITNGGGDDVSRVDDMTNGGGENASRVDDITNGGGDDVSRVDDITNGGGENVSRVDDITNGGGDDVSRVDDITNGRGDGFSRVDDITNNSADSSSSSVNALNSPTNLNYLDCTSLDPNKVYILGTLAEGSALYSLIDAENPDRFCTGFSSVAPAAVVSESGALIYRQKLLADQGALILVPEELSKNADETAWEYPEFPTENDINLFEMPFSGSDIHARAGAGVTEIYGSDGDTIYLNGSYYYEPETPFRFLGVMPDGSLLLKAFSPTESANLYLVDTDFNVTQLTPPVEGAYDFHPTTKLFINQDTGNQSVWVVAADNNLADPTESRWSIDLVTNIISNDGELATMPENIRGGIDKAARIDGSGDIVQISSYQNTTASYLVSVRRTLASAGVTTVILHSNSNGAGIGSWQVQASPFVYIRDTLATGP